MTNVRGCRDLKVWQKSMDLVVDCYQMNHAFPKSETFGLASQLQREGVSIAANIAEGRAWQHTKEFLQHVSIAYGSLGEFETYIQIAQRVDCFDGNQTERLLDKTSEIGRMINGLRGSLAKRV